MIGQLVQSILEFGLVMPGEPGKSHGALLSGGVAVTIEENGAEPGEKLAAPVVAAQTFPRFNQGVLGQVFGQGCVPAERHGLSQQARLIDPTDLAEGFAIARLSALDETPGVWGFAYHKRRIEAEHISSMIKGAGQSIHRPKLTDNYITYLTHLTQLTL